MGTFDVPEFSRSQDDDNFGLPQGEPKFEVTLPGYLQFTPTEAQRTRFEPSAHLARLIKMATQAQEADEGNISDYISVQITSMLAVYPKLQDQIK